MSAIDTTEQVLVVAVENYRREVAVERAEAARRLMAEQAEVRYLGKLCDVWQPDACKAPGCMTLVPTLAQLNQFRALGAEWDEAKAFAWQQGYCCAECAERDAGATNVLPFVRQTEAP